MIPVDPDLPELSRTIGPSWPPFLSATVQDLPFSTTRHAHSIVPGGFEVTS